MIAAMYLVKDLMLDWRLGERVASHYFLLPPTGTDRTGWIAFHAAVY